ncbi:unnamed protein product, partial [Rotaria sp. Silwood1]
MERSDDTNEIKTNADTTINIQPQRQLTMQRMLDAIRHAVQCRNANCIFKNCSLCKRLLQRTKECTKASRSQCQPCNKFLSPIWLHAKTCTDQNCLLPFSASFKHKIQRQCAATMQADRRRIKAMHRAKMGPGPSPINWQNSEPTTSGQYHHSMESASPSSTGKVMPSSGKGSKGGKPSSMSGLIRANLTQQLPTQQHSVYYNGKPLACNQQRIPYGGDPYIMRQQTPQVPSSASYPYSSNIAAQSYSYSQPMDINTQ